MCSSLFPGQSGGCSAGSKSDLLPLHELYTPAPAGLAGADPTAVAEVSVSSVMPTAEVETTNERLREDGTLKLSSFNSGQTDAPCNREGSELKMCSVFLLKTLNQEHIWNACSSSNTY